MCVCDERAKTQWWSSLSRINTELLIGRNGSPLFRRESDQSWDQWWCSTSGTSWLEDQVYLALKCFFEIKKVRDQAWTCFEMSLTGMSLMRNKIKELALNSLYATLNNMKSYCTRISLSNNQLDRLPNT